MNKLLQIFDRAVFEENALHERDTLVSATDKEDISGSDAVDEAMHDIFESMKALAADEPRRKKVARLLV